jgi:uncharacterized membrane protein YkvA (DUF1232 family)
VADGKEQGALVEIELNPREQRLYDRIRGTLRARAPGASSDLRDLFLLAPDLLILLLRLLRDSRVPLGEKGVALLGLGYVLSPIDLLPEFLFGPLGLVDDLVVLGLALSRILNHVHPDVVRAHWSGQGDALEAVQRLSGWCEQQLGSRLRRVFQR